MSGEVAVDGRSRHLIAALVPMAVPEEVQRSASAALGFEFGAKVDELDAFVAAQSRKRRVKPDDPAGWTPRARSFSAYVSSFDGA